MTSGDTKSVKSRHVLFGSSDCLAPSGKGHNILYTFIASHDYKYCIRRIYSFAGLDYRTGLLDLLKVCSNTFSTTKTISIPHMEGSTCLALHIRGGFSAVFVSNVQILCLVVNGVGF